MPLIEYENSWLAPSEKADKKPGSKKRKTTKLGAVGVSASLAFGAATGAVLRKNVAIPQLAEVDISIMGPNQEKPIDIDVTVAPKNENGQPKTSLDVEEEFRKGTHHPPH